MRVVVTGADGRLGSALVRDLRVHRVETLEWTLPAFDLDCPDTFRSAVEEARVDLIIHAAAWTDVDGCAREPELARRRNGAATGRLAEAARVAGSAFLYVSTNEVFDGRREDGRGYAEDDTTDPSSVYGAGKLEGERLAAAASSPCWIVRTAWLYGPPGRDFGTKVIEAALRARAEGRALSLVDEEMGSPTRAQDLADALLRLVGIAGPSEAVAADGADAAAGSGMSPTRPSGGPPTAPAQPGRYHLVNEGVTSRAGWAEALLADLDIRVATEHVSLGTWIRASTPPRWGVLDTSRAAAAGIRMRAWREALADEVPRYREWARAVGAGS